MGKALFLAAAYPFKKIIGIEFAEELNTIAQENIRNFKKDTIEAYCMDAVDYKIPDGPLVCYFYNPFDKVIMAKVIENIRQAYKKSKRNILIVYCEPVCHELFDAEQWLERRNSVWPITIWSSRD